MSTASSTGEAAGPQLGGVRGLYARFSHLIHEFGKFGLVGAICYLIDLTVFRLWLEQFGQRNVAVIVSTAIATTVAFAGNRLWTWRHSEHGRMHRQYLLYIGFNAVGIVISIGCLWLSHDVLGQVWEVLKSDNADTLSAKVVGVGLASLFRFWAYRKFIFPKPATPADPTAEAA